MAHNKLRRDIDIALASPNLTHSDFASIRSLLQRALDALGGPVADTRPEPEQIRDVPSELPEPFPLPTTLRPHPLVWFHGLGIFTKVQIEPDPDRPGYSRWMQRSWVSVCDVHHCQVTGTLTPHGPYYFCNDHYALLMDNIAKEQVLIADQIVGSGAEDIGGHCANVGELDTYVAKAPAFDNPPSAVQIDNIGDSNGH